MKSQHWKKSIDCCDIDNIVEWIDPMFDIKIGSPFDKWGRAFFYVIHLIIIKFDAIVHCA